MQLVYRRFVWNAYYIACCATLSEKMGSYKHSLWHNKMVNVSNIVDGVEQANGKKDVFITIIRLNYPAIFVVLFNHTR